MVKIEKILLGMVRALVLKVLKPIERSDKVKYLPVGPEPISPNKRTK